jgi:hypothetical protein
VNVIEWLVWLTLLGLVWVAFCASDLPFLLTHIADRYRHGGTR